MASHYAIQYNINTIHKKYNNIYLIFELLFQNGFYYDCISLLFTNKFFYLDKDLWKYAVNKLLNKNNDTILTLFCKNNTQASDFMNNRLKFLVSLSNVNYITNNLNTSLTYASKNGYFNAVKELLNKNANIHHVKKYNYNSLILASQNGHDKIVEILIQN